MVGNATQLIPDGVSRSVFKRKTSFGPSHLLGEHLSWYDSVCLKNNANRNIMIINFDSHLLSGIFSTGQLQFVKYIYFFITFTPKLCGSRFASFSAKKSA